MLRRIYLGFGEAKILDDMGINYKIETLRTPGTKVRWTDIELTDEQVKELEKKGVCVW